MPAFVSSRPLTLQAPTPPVHCTWLRAGTGKLAQHDIHDPGRIWRPRNAGEAAGSYPARRNSDRLGSFQFVRGKWHV